MDSPVPPQSDRFGNPLDPIVRYARGSILKSTDEEVLRMLRARQIVGERVRNKGKDSIYDLSGMNRGSGITAEDTQHLTSHVPFFERFEGKTEPYALKHMGADPATHSAIIINRVSAANFIALTTILKRGDRVLALAPVNGVSHPSTVRPISMAGANFQEFHSYAELEQEWHTGGAPASREQGSRWRDATGRESGAAPSSAGVASVSGVTSPKGAPVPPSDGAPRLLLITPISASKRHLPFEDFTRALALPRGPDTLVYVDDAHMASRVAFFEEPRTFQVGAIDIAVCSADKHVAGPRAGVLVGRKDLITTIGSCAYELGLEAQAGQYVGVANALRNFDPRVVKQAGELAKQLVEVLAQQYGAKRAYLGGPGVSIAGDDVIDIALEQRGGKAKPKLVAVEAAGLVAMQMLEQDGVLTIGAVAMPGSAPVMRLMMYPDGSRLGIERIVASLDSSIERLSEVIDDVDAAREQLLGA